jgi:hypothetical protein
MTTTFPNITTGRPGENPHNYQDSIRVEEPPQQKQKAPQTTINKNRTMKKTHNQNPHKENPHKELSINAC